MTSVNNSISTALTAVTPLSDDEKSKVGKFLIRHSLKPSCCLPFDGALKKIQDLWKHQSPSLWERLFPDKYVHFYFPDNPQCQVAFRSFDEAWKCKLNSFVVADSPMPGTVVLQNSNSQEPWKLSDDRVRPQKYTKRFGGDTQYITLKLPFLFNEKNLRPDDIQPHLMCDYAQARASYREFLRLFQDIPREVGRMLKPVSWILESDPNLKELMKTRLGCQGLFESSWDDSSQLVLPDNLKDQEKYQKFGFGNSHLFHTGGYEELACGYQYVCSEYVDQLRSLDLFLAFSKLAPYLIEPLRKFVEILEEGGQLPPQLQALLDSAPKFQLNWAAL